MPPFPPSGSDRITVSSFIPLSVYLDSNTAFRVAADHCHPNDVFLAGLRELDGLVEDEVHEGVEAAEDSLDGAVPVDLEVDPLVHDSRGITKPKPPPPSPSSP